MLGQKDCDRRHYDHDCNLVIRNVTLAKPAYMDRVSQAYSTHVSHANLTDAVVYKRNVWSTYTKYKYEFTHDDLQMA